MVWCTTRPLRTTTRAARWPASAAKAQPTIGRVRIGTSASRALRSMPGNMPTTAGMITINTIGAT